MFVDPVSSEYDFDLRKELAEVANQWNCHDVRHLVAEVTSRCFLEIPSKESVRSLSRYEIKPMMSSCSAGYKQNSDGSWEITAEIKFTNGDEKETKERENSNESSASQGTASKEADPPDSRDRDYDKN